MALKREQPFLRLCLLGFSVVRAGSHFCCTIVFVIFISFCEALPKIRFNTEARESSHIIVTT
jgi:hypothetical protein